MAHEQVSPLSETMKKVRDRAHADAGTTIAELVDIANWLEMSKTAGDLAEAGKLLEDYTFNLMVMGRMKNGKSTLLNALLEGTTRPVVTPGGRGLMAVGTRPTTAVLTTVHYSDNPSVKVVRMDGSEEPWGFEQYLRKSVLTADNEENQRIFEQIREFEIGYPAELCQEGVIVVDSPGTDEHPLRTQVTLDALRRADAVIRPYRSDVFVGANELLEDTEVRKSGTRVFAVVNLWDEAEADDEFQAWVWNRYLYEHLGKPKWPGPGQADFAKYDVYFVNGKSAFNARKAGDTGGVEGSGLAALERRLGDFLEQERFPVHLEKHATSAVREAAAIEEHLGQREAAVRADQRRLQDAYVAEQPKIEQIQARGDKLPMIFTRYQAQAELDLRSSFRQAVADLRRDLPGHMATVKLPSTGMIPPVMATKKLLEAASQEISEFATTRLDHWSQNEAPKLLAPISKRLSDEVTAEVVAISEQLDEINFRMSGWTVDTGGNARLVGTTERVVSAVAGLFFGDISAAVAGGAGGYRGALGGISGALGAAFILGALGVGAASIVFWPATLAAAAIAGLAAGGFHIEDRVKKKVLEAADPALATLPEATGDLIATKTAEFFGKAEEQVTAEVRGYIAEQVRGIEQFVELNQRDQADKDRALREYTQARNAVEKHIAKLEEAVAIARQG